ncbi:Uncharacterised protein [Burkholderia pseudomallei]|nr:hypothetical protein AQ744_29415 [Burkholderia pseudomallei]OMS78280.1 hypothetical protein AQ745_00245 [Burkholderia pseudomallei]OMS92330.1 hypothetical protein AQ747_22245 [Burkholderia pseudomallei]CAJ2915001.1 Uncharacterised protein [Burkholderia pseudomallei]CAJ3663255.1 Uncharacterised protein [Burkholderia pseudomallei]
MMHANGDAPLGHRAVAAHRSLDSLDSLDSLEKNAAERIFGGVFCPVRAPGGAQAYRHSSGQSVTCVPRSTHNRS